MGLEDYFISYRKPDEFVFIGSNNLSICRYVGKKWNLIYSNKSFSINDIGENFSEIIRSKVKGDEVGIVVGSSEFIYNLLLFEKIPFKQKVREDLINWKIQKLFPDIIGNYHHEYFKLSAKSILSILISNDIKKTIELKIKETEKNSIYFGCSTFEIINNLKRRKISPDFFIEDNSDQYTMVFLDKHIPYYIRKIRFTDQKEGKEGIAKTIEFVENNYNKSIRSYSVLLPPGLVENDNYIEKILGIDKLNVNSLENFFPK